MCEIEAADTRNAGRSPGRRSFDQTIDSDQEASVEDATPPPAQHAANLSAHRTVRSSAQYTAPALVQHVAPPFVQPVNRQISRSLARGLVAEVIPNMLLPFINEALDALVRDGRLIDDGPPPPYPE